MGNYKFYTPPEIAESLIDLLPNRAYSNVIDICCGSWSLLKAAQKRFGQSKFVGVDVDSDAEASCFEGAKFYCKDGRSFAISEKRKYDLILSNPPFGYLKDDERLLKNMVASENVIQALLNKRYENEMMQANLLLSSPNGILLFILPITFLEGDTYLAIRRDLCQKYTIDSIIYLPVETFGSSKISTFALIMKNSGKQNSTAKLQRIIHENQQWKVKQLGNISAERMKNGEWENKEKIKKISNAPEIFRGNISTTNMGNTGTRVFHCSSTTNGGAWKPSIRYCDDKDILSKAKMALPGDIIVNRIGRYAAYWCVCRERIRISDCLIVIRETEKDSIYQRIIRNSTNGKLNISPRGVTTRYITINDILGML